MTKKTKASDSTGFPLKHYSYSSLVKFCTNPILFKINYINGDRFDTAMGISGVIGQAFHLAMEVYYGGTDQAVPANESEAIELGLKAGMKFLEEYNDGFINYSKTIANKQKAFDMFSFAFQSYVKENPYKANGEEILFVEEELEEMVDIEWRGQKLNLPIKLKGRIDKIITKDGQLIIEDYKTCSKFSSPDKIDGSKIIQAVQYYLLVSAKTGQAPYSIRFHEVKMTKNSEGGPQVQHYEIVYAENDLFFDFYFRIYEDVTRALNGEMVYVPNVYAMFDNEVAMVSYIHRLDVLETTAELMKKHKVSTLTELLKREIQSASNMKKLMKSIDETFISAKNLNYSKMTNQEKIQTKLLEHGMMLQFDSLLEGSTVDLYRYTPSIGLKMSRINSYVADMEQVLGISGIRVLAPIPGSTMVGFEVPRAVRTFPNLPDSFDGFSLAIGQTIDGANRMFDIREAPHMLVAGASGSGKSVFLNNLIKQLLAIKNVKLHLFDPKQVELLQFEGLPGVFEYVHNHKSIALALQNLVEEMERRYTLMRKSKAKSILEMPKLDYRFVIIDEYADLAMKSEVQNNIQLLAQKGRACGIHIILATQRASSKIINGDIKVNFPTKAVFRMSKEVDSRVMLDEGGAEKLLGKGDMIFSWDGGNERLQGYSGN